MSGLQLDRLVLRELNLPLKYPFETSFGRTTNRRVLIIQAIDSDGAAGYGECVAMEAPLFSGETIDTAWIIIAKHIAPLLASQGLQADNVFQALSPIRGNQMAKGAVEAAVWDLESRRLGLPLWKHLGGTRTEIACGVSIGIQSSTGELLETVARELDSGYQRIKIKIKPGQDLKLVQAVRSRYKDIVLSVDANAAYFLDRDAALMKELDNYNLLMIEQPLAPGDLVDHAKLQRQLSTPLCLDESIASAADARYALELGACRIINIKLGRVGGFSQAREIQALALRREIPVWCGGMLETGIGRAHNIAMSSLPGFTLPGDVSASQRYWSEDIIEPEVEVSSRGTIEVSKGPGFGFRVRTDRMEKLTVRLETVPVGSLTTSTSTG
ncbi:MAG: o-succinylbenzoate synthase [Candidatus Acidiferrales bacterium]